MPREVKAASYGLAIISTSTEEAMSFGLYGLGLVVLIGGLVYVAVLTHVHTQWIVAMVIVLVGAGLMAAVNNTKQRDSK
jgi:succinate-acetate transporter protein